MNFLEECIQDSLPIWEACLETEFLKGVADGSLPEDCFMGYIVDDSLYLRAYARVFAWGMTKAQTMGVTTLTEQQFLQMLADAGIEV